MKIILTALVALLFSGCASLRAPTYWSPTNAASGTTDLATANYVCTRDLLLVVRFDHRHELVLGDFSPDDVFPHCVGSAHNPNL